MRKIIIGVVSAVMVAGGLMVGAATVAAPGQQGVWQVRPGVSVQAWSFDNKDRKNKKKPTIHHGLW